MIENAQSTIIEIPEGFRIYVFGSFLVSKNPGDLDILGVYDETHISPLDAYVLVMPLIQSIKKKFKLPIDLTMLSKREAEESKFVTYERCVELSHVISESPF